MDASNLILNLIFFFMLILQFHCVLSYDGLNVTTPTNRYTCVHDYLAASYGLFFFIHTDVNRNSENMKK